MKKLKKVEKSKINSAIVFFILLTKLLLGKISCFIEKYLIL
jgi:hypothetical protein